MTAVLLCILIAVSVAQIIAVRRANRALDDLARQLDGHHRMLCEQLRRQADRKR